MIGKGLLKGLGITFKHGWEKNITIQYPEVMPNLQERYRGSLEFDPQNCIICGMCTKVCPNNVLSFESAPMPGSKKKQLVSYTIDLQYCMFCNLCVEACPTHTLYFTHNFELSTARRGEIKRVYSPPAKAQVLTGESQAELIPAEALEPQPDAEAEAKRLKQLQAIKGAIARGNSKVLEKFVDFEEDASLLMTILQADQKKQDKMAELMVDDKNKARKVAAAFVAKEKRDKTGPEEGKH